MNRARSPLWILPLFAALAVVAYALTRHFGANLYLDVDLGSGGEKNLANLGAGVLNLALFGLAEWQSIMPLSLLSLGLSLLVFVAALACHWWPRRAEIGRAGAKFALLLLGFLAYLAVLSAVIVLTYNDIAVAMGAVVLGALLVCAGVFLYSKSTLWAVPGLFCVSLVAITVSPIDGFLLVVLVVLAGFAAAERSLILTATAVVYLVVVWWPQWTARSGPRAQILSQGQWDQLNVFWLTARVYIGPVSVLLLGAIAVVVSDVLAKRRSTPEPSL